MASHLAYYDVFLSFRGEDTRHSFTDHLYDALGREGISTFRDDVEISRGEEVGPEIEKAIRASKGSIVVLSKNYATSTWCLDELSLILERRQKSTHFVLPVFYHVEPSDVKKQDGTFNIEVKTSSKWTEENVIRWKKALTEVANLSGLVLSGYETDLLKEIINEIHSKLPRKKFNIPPNLIGMNARYKGISSWLEQSDVKVLAICGMGGSGKTTFAQYIVSSIWQHFEVVSVVGNIASTRENKQSFDKLFRNFVKDILGGGRKYIEPDSFKLRYALAMKKALIVLDDINEPSQFREFLERFEILNPQSKIIITTRKIDTHTWLISRKGAPISCREYAMQVLGDDESLELLSLHAFGSKMPIEGYEELAKEVIQYCGGNPLALKVLGSSLREDSSILFWRSTLNLLKIEMNPTIQDVLVRSYNTLPNKKYKELFLHIACFFVGEDKDYVEKILEPDYCASSGIKVLTNRCLLSVSPNNKLVMHQLIQEMGRSITVEESRHPEERSRVWRSSDSHKILRKGEGSKTMEGLALDMQVLQFEQPHLMLFYLRTDSLIKMDNLKLLQLNDVHLTGSYEDFSEDLRWLCWHRFDLTAIPSGLFQQNLVAIDLRDSKLEVFDPPIVLPLLKTLNLQGCKSLSKICNISRLPNLETLIVCSCPELGYVCESIEGLENLTLLDMTGCKTLPWLHLTISNIRLEASAFGRGSPQPISFSLPHSLVWLSLGNCDLDCTEYFPLDFNSQPKLQYLDLVGGRFVSLPSYSHLESLRVLDLTLCQNLKCLVCLPSSLAELYIHYCTSLEKITFKSHQFTLQEFGYEGCGKLSEIEGFIKLVPIAELDENDLQHMTWLKTYQDHEVSLMLHEFGIMSTSLPNIVDPNMIPEYQSESSSVSFCVPPCPRKRRLKGLNVTFKYELLVWCDWWVWFAKIHTNNAHADLMYSPKVFGKPKKGDVGIWLSYWPIGNMLDSADEVDVSIFVLSGLKVHECGVSLVYTDDDDDQALEINTPWVETLGGDLSAFKLSTGAYYLCRHDLFNVMNGHRLGGWLRLLVGHIIDDTEVQGWRKTGRPKPSDPSFTELSHPSTTDLQPYPSFPSLPPLPPLPPLPSLPTFPSFPSSELSGNKF
ncbi:hypothetical protein OSB04_015119 [Centaurea solstitialis]|uniref:TIR domain-containing protein n=1 Tax=Centaurea solstitialis TaxID=347529 RepID=A0AA38WIF1_9ASTR|nr:hypothetical protein OSB04_015119 [Centaurea solstitialis]